MQNYTSAALFGGVIVAGIVLVHAIQLYQHEISALSSELQLAKEKLKVQRYQHEISALSSGLQLAKEKLEVQRYQHEISALSSELQLEKEKREVERKGRIQSQKRARESIQKDQERGGYVFSPIGVIESPFPERRGTPRQPSLVTAARGRIRFNQALVQNEHYNELGEFSHVWVVWVFHDNTNLDAKTVAAKIKPPRLHGAKVGCLSTRSPHRPNPIGLSVVEVVGIGKGYIDIACVDMVHGTPVLDVKPYIPYDVVPYDFSTPMMNDVTAFRTKLHVPSWIHEADVPMREVRFSNAIQDKLHNLAANKHLKFCNSKEDIMLLITQVLRQDIRSVYQGRGSDDATPSRYECTLDSIVIEFSTLKEYIQIEAVELKKKARSNKEEIGAIIN